ncbi:hypothetical protein PFNF54_00306 [Plasmodium falciparum NF54]|uniref:Uncharacterized protein n=1 Tax=Plasmodium falciparum (isolate NF54) TaxID=5843 RepID=W7KB29_PLAFO|nr:hypothetical protein PFNF54_00306 [Plasmodium falciparum NF54]
MAVESKPNNSSKEKNEENDIINKCDDSNKINGKENIFAVEKVGINESGHMSNDNINKNQEKNKKKKKKKYT